MINEAGRDAIADAMMAQDIADVAPTASQTAAQTMAEDAQTQSAQDQFSAPSFNSPMSGRSFGEAAPTTGSGNILSAPEGGRGTPGSPGFHSPGFDMFGSPATQTDSFGNRDAPDFGRSGNMFDTGVFDAFGNAVDPIGDMFGPDPGTPTAPSFNSTPGVPADPGDPFGNSDQIASNNSMVADMVAAMSGDIAGLGDVSGEGGSSSSSSGDNSGSEGASGGVG